MRRVRPMTRIREAGRVVRRGFLSHTANDGGRSRQLVCDLYVLAHLRSERLFRRIFESLASALR